MAIIIGADALSKQLSLQYLNVHMNAGLFMGSFQNAPTLFRVVGLSVLSGFLLLFYFMALYLLPSGLRKIKIALSFVIGGVLGNVFNRLVMGVTVDFIPIKIFSFEAYFNIADVFLFSGVSFFTYLIFKEEKEIWFEDNKRSKFLINPKEQFWLSFKFMFFSWITSLVIGIFVWAYVHSYFANVKAANIGSFFLLYSLLSFLLCAIIFMLGIVISHRTAGPLHAFEIYIEKLLQGEKVDFKLRKGDNLKQLEVLAEKLRKLSNK